MKTKSGFLAVFLTVLLLPIFLSAQNEDTKQATTVTDIDGNVYHSVRIGTQVWMVENLKTTRYRNGDTISNLITKKDWWRKLNSGAYCLNNKVSEDYGALYNWFAVADSRNISPVGWHVPTVAEWIILVEGLKIKEAGTVNFNNIPGGYRKYNGRFVNFGYYGYWWAAAEHSTTFELGRYVYYDNGYVVRGGDCKFFGFSVRCVKD